jgi:hypothetical protein
MLSIGSYYRRRKPRKANFLKFTLPPEPRQAVALFQIPKRLPLLGAFPALRPGNRAIQGSASLRPPRTAPPGQSCGGPFGPFLSLARANSCGVRLGSFAPQNSWNSSLQAGRFWFCGVLLRKTPGTAPASMPFLSCKFFALQKTYETITAGLLPACGFGFAEFCFAKLSCYFLPLCGFPNRS